MAYKCGICGTNEVSYQGDICELCKIGQDPYAFALQSNEDYSPANDNDFFQAKTTIDKNTDNSSVYVPGKGRNRKVLLDGGAGVSNTDPYGNSLVSQDESPVQVYQPGQIPTTSSSAGMVVSTGLGSTNNNKTTAKYK